MNVYKTFTCAYTPAPLPTRMQIDRARLHGIITTDEIDHVVDRPPFNKAPDKDGLPFELYRYILPVPWINELFTAIINDTPSHTSFSTSWLDTVTIFLFNTGDATMLANWRLLSLINSDTQLVTKILTLRIQLCMSKLTRVYWTGFRFTAVYLYLFIRPQPQPQIRHLDWCPSHLPRKPKYHRWHHTEPTASD